MFSFFWQLEEIIQEGLEGNEYASFLAWVTNEYPGPKLMQHPDLQVDLSNMEPLLKAESLKELENEYLKVWNKLDHYEISDHQKLTNIFSSDHGEELRRMDGKNS